MAADSNTREITILLDESCIEELRGWLTVNNGEIIKVKKPRRKTSSTPEQQGPQVAEDEASSSHADVIDDLQRDVVAAQSNTEPSEDSQFCTYCRNSPCVILSDNIPSKLKAHGQPRMTNHSKRKGDYKAFYTILKRRGLWRDPVYLQRKEALGCYVEDVREVMPICVVENVRKRWPNPDGVPYCGHRRS